MRLKPFEKVRKVVTTIVVVALVAAVSYTVSGLLLNRHPAFALGANKDFSISGSVYPSTCTTAHGTALLYPGVTRCLVVTVEDPLSVPMKVRSISMTVTTTNAPLDTSACPPSTLTVPTLFAGAFTVGPSTSVVIHKRIELKTSGATQDACENKTFHFSFSGTATYTDTTTTALSATLTGTTGRLLATVTPAHPTIDTFGPATAPTGKVVDFYSCTSSTCTTKTLLAGETLTSKSTKSASATYAATGLSAGTHYFEAVYPGTTSTRPDFSGSTSPVASLTVPRSPSIPHPVSSPTSVSLPPPTTLPPPAPPPGVTVVAGPTADATAAAELTRVFPSGTGVCPASRDAVLATTKVFQDALSSQYLAQKLTTGTLLTPTKTLSPVTVTMLKKEGVNTVYIVGGPLAIDTTVAQQIAALTAYECGGRTRTPTTGKIVVHRIWGKTQYGTAKAVAEFVGTGASLTFPGAYSGTDATGGTGRYNDTGAKGTSAPTGAVPTAILADGTEFQDAQAASVISYRTKVPLLLTAPTTLTTTAVGAIRKLGIKQVIVMGGTKAITNGVEASLVAKTGVAVLRVAGQNYVDTAAQLARFEAAVTGNGLGWTPGHRILVARGNGFTDGIAGADLENAKNTGTHTPGAGRPLLLTENPTTVGTSLTAFLKVTGHTGIDRIKTKTVTDLTVLGGPKAVSTTVIAAMQTDLAH